MLTLEQRMHMYKGKKLFIDSISKVFEIEFLNSNVKKVEYEVYSQTSQISDTVFYAEFVVVTFTSGAISVRNISGNSNNANFREIGKLIDGGYYDEIEYYKKVKENSTFVEV